MTVSFRVRDGVEFGPLGRRIMEFVQKYYPHQLELYVTSAYRPTDTGSHHSGRNYLGSPTAAVDFGGYDDSEPNDKDQRDMGLFADWLFQYFWDLTVELIHTQPHNDHYTYVKAQQRVGAYATADHVNHIHWATSAVLMDRIEARGRQLWGDGSGGGVVTPPAGPNTTFSLPAGHYYGDLNGPNESHGGFNADERDEVKLIQERLQVLKFAPNVSGWADGLFEQATIDAVKSFQAANGLQVDGRVGPLTWAKLFDQATPPSSGPPPVDTGTIFGCDLYDFTYEGDNPINDEQVKRLVTEGGLKFINAKFTEMWSDSGKVVHRKAIGGLKAALSVGLEFPCGFVVPRSSVSIDAQLDFLLETADREFPQWRTHPDFFWQVDLEHWPYDKVAPEIGVAMAKRLMVRSQKPAMLYGPKWAYGDSIPNYPGRLLWASNYTGSGASRDYRDMYLGDSAPGWAAYSGTTPTINQYCSDGRVAGYGDLVMSAFRGNADSFRAVLASALAPYKETPPPPPPPVEPPTSPQLTREAVKSAVTTSAAGLVEAMATAVAEKLVP